MPRWVKILTLSAWILRAEAQSFESVSINPSITSPGLAADRGELIGWKIEPPRVKAGHVGLPNLVMRAYDIQTSQLQGPIWGLSPSSPDSPDGLFDIDAKMPAGTSAGQVPAMLQKMLAERFGLKIHRVTSDIEILALVTAPDGPKLQPKPAGPAKTLAEPNGMTHIEVSRIAELLSLLAITLGQAPVDKTGLTGTFDIRLDMPLIAPVPPGGDRIAAFLENISGGLEKMGLRLERQKQPVESLMVDHIERTPTKN
ncbi:MAG: TIGR03435 family protein [Acidobacteriota bacterium]